DSPGARMIWEANGPGNTFGKEVARLGYRRFWTKPTSERSLVMKRNDVIPGWWSSTESRKNAFLEYRRGLIEHRCINRSARSIAENKQYINSGNGKIVHRKQIGLEDPTGSDDNHGDLVIGDVLAYKVIQESAPGAGGLTKKQDKKQPILPGSFAWRRQERE